MDISNSTSYPKTTTSTLSASQQIAQKKPPEINHNNAASEDLSAADFRVERRIRIGRRRKTTSKDGGGEELMDERGVVEKKIVALQKIVPGGERLPVEELFEETAEYILTLESRVKALKFLVAFVQSSENMKNKMFSG
ncbi:hypothetical protein ACS0TY_017232 [Phlomoides rotata]